MELKSRRYILFAIPSAPTLFQPVVIPFQAHLPFIIGSECTELIAEIGLAMNLEATWDEIEATIHAHPTLSEMVKEATEVAKGHPIHV